MGEVGRDNQVREAEEAAEGEQACLVREKEARAAAWRTAMLVQHGSRTEPPAQTQTAEK